MGLNAKTDPLVAANTPFGGGVSDLTTQIEASKVPGSLYTSRALQRIQQVLNNVQAALQQQSAVQEITVTDDETGELIAWFGSKEVNGVRYRNYLKEVYIGGPDDPTHALIYTDAFGHVYIGSNGSLSILDPFGASAAWIGTKYDTYPVTGAANNGSGAIRLTVTGHAYATGDTSIVADVGGVPNAAGTWTVTKIDANHIDLQGSYFDGVYTSGGTVTRLLHVTGAANNGSGLIRLTITAHGYSTGDKVSVASVGGVSAATGQWVVEAVDANHIDLLASTWGGAYTSGGVALRYFAGGSFQTLAVGSATGGWDDAKLRAQANGDLLITDAIIKTTGAGSTISIDPVAGSITVEDVGTGNRAVIQNGQIFLFSGDEQTTLNAGRYEAYAEGLTTLALASAVSTIFGYSAATPWGPIIKLAHSRGTAVSYSPTLNNDILGGLLMTGINDAASYSPQLAGFYAVAAEDFLGSAMGTRVVINITPLGTNTATTAATFEPDKTLLARGDVDTSGVFKVAGTKVVGARQVDPGTAATSPTVATTTVTQTAGAIYTATEQSMLATLKTAVNQLNTDVSNLKTQVDNLITDRDRWRTIALAHGLMA